MRFMTTLLALSVIGPTAAQAEMKWRIYAKCASLPRGGHPAAEQMIVAKPRRFRTTCGIL
ncbi:hypothetical protein QA644_10405 [Rhizobium sp. CC1099]|uniref:hypothetical protein n=1 Tax=Rhizobium sp. CC1099 TaxID=3039160 RepID=UPI0024B14B1B|nr:hypothetical protein [Rhizobium sp. CC1099]WFU89411.1 hypothetical protein QA644_10405 [Rhizobium sp. CC1099]